MSKSTRRTIYTCPLLAKAFTQFGLEVQVSRRVWIRLWWLFIHNHHRLHVIKISVNLWKRNGS